MNKTTQPRQGNHTDESLTSWLPPSLFLRRYFLLFYPRHCLLFLIPPVPQLSVPPPAPAVWSLKAWKSFLLRGKPSDQGLECTEETANGGPDGRKRDGYVHLSDRGIMDLTALQIESLWIQRSSMSVGLSLKLTEVSVLFAGKCETMVSATVMNNLINLEF